MAAKPERSVSETELCVLQVLWDSDCCTIRQITDVIYPEGGPTKYWTVQKLLERLEEKGYVRRQRQGTAHTFEAVVGRDEMIGRSLQEVARSLCGGSLTPLLTHLVRNRPLSSAERQELRDLINELDAKGKGKSSPR
jgi:predicted transcriptional regulator